MTLYKDMATGMYKSFLVAKLSILNSDWLPKMRGNVESVECSGL